MNNRTERWQVANALPGWRAFAASLAEAGVTRVGIEATGGYERGVVEHLQAAGFTLLVLQPIQVKAFGGYTYVAPRTMRSMRLSLPPCAAALDEPEIEARRSCRTPRHTAARNLEPIRREHSKQS